MNSDDEDLYFIAAAANYISSRSTRKKPKYWLRNFLKKRATHGAYNSILNDLRIEDRNGFKNFVRMGPQEFESLLRMVAPHIVMQDTKFRDSVSPSEQLTLTLRYLATGNSYSSLMYSHRISKAKISKTIPNVCDAICKVLTEYIKMPSNCNEWMSITREFNTKWNFPHCLGALDGKHIEIIKPAQSGSEYINYQKTFSIVLMALVDANYNFIFVDIGVQGRISDGGVFKNTSLYRKLSEGQLNIPEPQHLPNRTTRVPYVIVADDAFALQENVQKPFPGILVKGSRERIFNYRLSRARVVVENAFGILSAVFRVLRSQIGLSPKKTQIIVLACVHLHNFLRRSRTGGRIYTPSRSFDHEDIDTGNITPGSWRQNNPGLIPLQRIPRRSSQGAQAVRDEFTDYFVSEEGSVSWQARYA